MSSFPSFVSSSLVFRRLSGVSRVNLRRRNTTPIATGLSDQNEQSWSAKGVRREKSDINTDYGREKRRRGESELLMLHGGQTTIGQRIWTKSCKKSPGCLNFPSLMLPTDGTDISSQYTAHRQKKELFLLITLNLAGTSSHGPVLSDNKAFCGVCDSLTQGCRQSEITQPWRNRFAMLCIGRCSNYSIRSP